MTGSKSSSDRPPREAQRRLGRVRLAGVAAALVAALLLMMGDGAQHGIFDRYQRWFPAAQGTSATEVVMIDADSLREIGPWPWPRYLIARLTEEIAARGATAIGFDITFPEPDRYNPQSVVALYPELAPATKADIGTMRTMDDTFAEVIGQKPVVLARVGVDRDSVDYERARRLASTGLVVEAAFTAPLPATTRTYDRVLTNIVEYEEVAPGQGLINGPTDDDGVVRQVPLVARIRHATVDPGAAPDNVAVAGIALELARLAQGLTAIEPIVAGGVLKAIRLGRRTLPVTPAGDLRLHFGHFPEDAAIEAYQLFKRDRAGRRFAADRFRGKVVIVGLTATGTSDAISTPLAPQEWGVYVQAQAVNAILSGQALDRPAWAAPLEWAGGAALALVAILLFPRLRMAGAVAVPIAIAALVIAASVAAFAGAGLLIDPLRPLAIGGAAAAAVLVALFGEGVRSQRKLREALQQQRLAAAKAQGELDAAKRIQLGMLPPHEQLRRLDPRFDLDAAIEPAREVGGDFYDAVRLPDGRLCFLIADVTGKGVPAALFMALSKALSKSALLRTGADLAAAVDELNTEISRDNSEDMFVTMLVGIADPLTGEVELCNAGHENPLVIRADGRIDTLPLDGGPPLCVAEGFPYTVERVTLAIGDALVLVTDGVTEAESPAGGFFEVAGIIDTLDGWQGGAGETTDRLFAAVRAFEAGGEPSDDVTIMALRYRGAVPA